MLAALGFVTLGLVLTGLTGPGARTVFALTLLAGLIAAGTAVAQKLRQGFATLEARLDAASLLAGAALVLLVGWLALNQTDWDSLAMVVCVGLVVATVGAVLVLMPWDLRKWVLSFFILFHFGGILSAMTTVPAGSGSFPWLASLLWTRVFRHYLLFTYMNNAYHFYSPDPGPPTLLWFLIEYEDGSKRWVQLARRSDFTTRLEYQRFLAVTESTNQILSSPSVNAQLLVAARDAARTEFNPPLPTMASIPHATQYREPQDYSKRMVASYVRHVGRAAEYQKSGQTIKNIKVYRVIHSILNAADMAAGADPLDLTTYQPYFQGDFDVEGTLKNPNDPFLYWILPIFTVHKGYDSLTGLVANPRPGEYETFDCLSIHAGDSNWNPYPKK
jgi:hypothetical protein